MKYISFAVFGADKKTPANAFEFYAYMRGLFFNIKMAQLLFPDWKVYVTTDSPTHSRYDHFFNDLHLAELITLDIQPADTLCRSMLWRMRPIFLEDTEYVMCRDADSLITYREALMIQEFIDSGLDVHSITDNPAHTLPMMGGMCSFRAKPLRDLYKTHEKMIARYHGTIDQRGTDQSFLNAVIFPQFAEHMMGHYLQGYSGAGVADVKNSITHQVLRNINQRYWESNLCVQFAGAPGMNELETIRFFKRLNIDIDFGDTGPKYPKIFNWIER